MCQITVILPEALGIPDSLIESPYPFSCLLCGLRLEYEVFVAVCHDDAAWGWVYVK